MSSAREELIEIVTRDRESSGGDSVWAADLVEAALRAEREKGRRDGLLEAADAAGEFAEAGMNADDVEGALRSRINGVSGAAS